MNNASAIESTHKDVATAGSNRRTPIEVATKVTFVLLAAFGLAIRFYALGRQAINADQAVVGLMAHQILHGHFSAFYWGQNYGGGEPYVVAIVFAIFGQSTFSLGLTPVILDLVAAILVWRIGRRLFDERVGLVAGLLFWIWPEVYIWQSTVEYGFRWFVLDVGLAALLVTLRIVSNSARAPRTEAFLLGLFLGAGWWGSPEIMYFALPIVAYVALSIWRDRLRIPLERFALAIVGALIGASVWLEVNVRQHFSSLHSGVQPDAGMLHHLKVFVQHTVPLLLGLQLRVSGNWVIGAGLGELANVVAIGGAIVLLGVLVRRREALLLVLFCVFGPFIYAISPFTWYWADGRYAIFLAPATSLVAVVSVRELLSLRVCSWISAQVRIQLYGALALAAGLGLTLAAVTQLAPYRPDGVAQTGSATWTSWSFDPSSGLASVATRLAQHNIHDLYAGYWVAYPLMFASKGEVVASDISYVRNPGILAELESHHGTAWLFLNPHDYRLGVALTGVSLMDPSCAALSDRCLLPSEFTNYLDQRHIAYRTVNVDPFVAIIPERPVSTLSISNAYRLRAPYVLAP